MKTLPGLASFALFIAALASVEAKFDFGPWAAGTSPQEVGRRVAENFAARPHSNFNKTTPPNSITYPETCTWYGALTFAQLTGNKELTAKLVARFEPMFGDDAHFLPKPSNVDSTVFGTVPFELYIQTKDNRYLPICLNLADKQWETPADTSKLKPEALEGIAAGLTWHTRFGSMTCR